MKNALTVWIILLAGLFSVSAFAHISWDQIDDYNCPQPYSCNDTPLVFMPGESISVVYDVIIQHQNLVEIDISSPPGSGLGIVSLRSGLPEDPGLNSTSIRLPDWECDSCTLTVRTGTYTGIARIQLSSSPMSNGMAPMEIANITSMEEDSSIHLFWSNPTQYFEGVVILQSEVWSVVSLEDGMTYAAGDRVDAYSVVYSGMASEWMSSGLDSGKEYFYKIFAYNNQHMYSSGAAYSATTTAMGNNPPWPQLSVHQGGSHEVIIDPDAGLVMVELSIDDADQADMFQIDWQETDTRIVDTDSDDYSITFDPSQLAEGDYMIKVTVWDDGTPVMSNSTEIQLTVQMSMQASPNPPARGSKKSGGSLNILFLATLALSGFIARLRIRRAVFNNGD